MRTFPANCLSSLFSRWVFLRLSRRGTSLSDPPWEGGSRNSGVMDRPPSGSDLCTVCSGYEPQWIGVILHGINPVRLSHQKSCAHLQHWRVWVGVALGVTLSFFELGLSGFLTSTPLAVQAAQQVFYEDFEGGARMTHALTGYPNVPVTQDEGVPDCIEAGADGRE